jgi:hypothetical protein
MPTRAVGIHVHSRLLTAKSLCVLAAATTASAGTRSVLAAVRLLVARIVAQAVHVADAVGDVIAVRPHSDESEIRD